MIVLCICLLAATAIGCLIYALLPKSEAVHDRIAQLSGAHSANEQRITAFGQVYDEKSKSAVQQLLLEAGWYDCTPGKMAFMNICGVLAGAIVTSILLFVVHVEGSMKIVAYLMLVAGYRAPRYFLNKAVTERKAAIQSELPDFVDMVSSTVAAGIALNGALLSAVEMCSGPLGDEFRATLADIRMGRARADALHAMADRVNQIDLSQFVTAVVQSERVGGNLATVLEDLANESRERRLMRAEEIAGTLPVKMTIPMALLLLPALFVVLLGPVVMNDHL